MRATHILFLPTFSFILATSAIHLRAEDAPAKEAEEKKPLNYCIVSGERLQPGDIVTYIYKQEGKPDRTIRFCCHKCLARFKANPERYLKKLDAEPAQPSKDGS